MERVDKKEWKVLTEGKVLLMITNKNEMKEWRNFLHERV